MLSSLRSSLAFHRTGLRLLGVVRKIDPTLLPVNLVYALAQVAGVYVGLALTAGLVDALVALERAARWSLRRAWR